MNLSEKDKKEWEELLMERELMNEGDSIVEYVKGDYYSFGQNRGRYFFTNESLIFISGLGGTVAVLPYRNIKEIKKCLVGPFIPTGVKVTVFDEEKGKNKKHKLSLLGRKKWMEYLSQQSGVAL